MAGNSARKGAVRKSKKGATVGSGGQRARGLAGKGPTPKATERKGHPAARRAAAAERRSEAPRRRGAPGKNSDAPELLVGRNPVAEALRAAIPATALYVAVGIEADERVTDAIRLAADRGLPILEVSKSEIDRRTGGILHQGIALQVPAFSYDELPDLLDLVASATTTPLLVALDGVTDPRNLGAVIRSAVAFGAQGVILPTRRSAGVTATAWRTSAGTAARLPVAQVTNLVRALRDCQKAGLQVVGLDADGGTTLDQLPYARDPLVIVVGSEGRGLSRLVGETCDLTVSIPMAGQAESLNASVAAAVAMAEVARQRRQAG
ncbi:23S rRNA (guanosine(2251)-2'-O)-methyltransferase RlmB [Jatrophihabitans sp.]|uniref:23S rRNA (guanosine(2251)-2'-O)-methyltransferase RlmB n=1 Tax=Jatrophihabitans sp. TaxID=1932789 RepID=UPI002D037EEC|nr:23S rRNA (guanosine(2251)-2'-O)-methyltransferase RlmB [Jatrophihabitans sp.]